MCVILPFFGSALSLSISLWFTALTSLHFGVSLCQLELFVLFRHREATSQIS